MGVRDRLRRAERAAEGETVAIPRPDGTMARFPKSAPQESFLVNMRRLRGGDVPPHPLGVAAAESPDPEWSGSFYAASWAEAVTPPPELSE